MTREEASNLFNQIKDGKQKFNEVCGEKDYIDLRVGNNFFEALDMAIEALEQEPCNNCDYKEWLKGEIEQEPCEDCISRQAVLDMVEDITDQFGNKHRVVTEGMISLLPPATPKQKVDVLDKIRAELHATAEMHEDGDYYLRDEWIDEIFDEYKAESEDKE